MAETANPDRRLCLDLINTVSWRRGANRRDDLTTAADLISWAEKAGLLPPGDARLWDADPAAGRRILEQTVTVRELLFRLFSAVAAGNPPAAQDLEDFNDRLGQSLARIRLVQRANGYAWAFHPGQKPLERILDPVLRSAADLLVSPDLQRLKICADHSCGWLFFDMSRNRSRRWCDMRDCGNRAKARRYYRRQSAPPKQPRDAGKGAG